MCHHGMTLSYLGTKRTLQSVSCGGVSSLKVVSRWVSKRKQYDTIHTHTHTRHLLKVNSPLWCTNTTLKVLITKETTYTGVGPFLPWAEGAAILPPQQSPTKRRCRPVWRKCRHIVGVILAHPNRPTSHIWMWKPPSHFLPSRRTHSIVLDLRAARHGRLHRESLEGNKWSCVHSALMFLCQISLRLNGFLVYYFDWRLINSRYIIRIAS